MQLNTNTLLQGNTYKILNVLGQGGFGITYLAEHTNSGRKVAIKELFLKELCGRDESTNRVITHLDHATVERFRAKFLKEAKILMSLNHRNIVRVYDCFEENNTAYYVMEYIEGISINDMLRQSGRIDEQTAVGYIRKVANALLYIHEKSINHLDVKPANILLRHSDNEIILIDFGTAKHYDTATGGATTMTQAGYSQGYAAIEQYRQGGVSTFSPETDIYSLGATLYKMLTGQTPPEPSLLLEDGLPPLPKWISSSTKGVITSSMQIQKAVRPHSIAEFLNILDNEVISNPNDENTRTLVGKKSSNNTVGYLSKDQETYKTEFFGLMWLFLIIAIGGIMWYVYTSNGNDSTSLNAKIESSENSVDMVSQNDVLHQDKDNDDIINFLWKVYSNRDYSRKDWIEKHCTSKLKKKLLKEMEDTYINGRGYAVWLFDSSDEIEDVSCRIGNIKYKNGLFYVILKYNYDYDGNAEHVATIRLSCKKINGLIMIDDIVL